jgi:hypothetical protein
VIVSLTVRFTTRRARPGNRPKSSSAYAQPVRSRRPSGAQRAAVPLPRLRNGDHSPASAVLIGSGFGERSHTPKSRAGRRKVAFPVDLVSELRWHLDRFSEPGPRGLVFVGPKGASLRRSNFRLSGVRHASQQACPPALPRLSRPQTHRGNARRRHGRDPQGTDGPARALQPRAAMIYQHATRDRDQVIAEALGGLARQAREGQAKNTRDA